MKPPHRSIGLYAIMAALAAGFLFPFYWVIICSLKSPAALSMSPPAFYPGEVRTKDLAVSTASRIVIAEGARWLRLCIRATEHGSERQDGTYYLRLGKGDGPTKLVAWLPDDVVRPLSDPPPVIVFERAPIHRLTGTSKEVAVAATMVRQNERGFDELLFVAPADSGSTDEFAVLCNVEHEPLCDFAPQWQNYSETLRGPEATIGAKSTGFSLYLRNSLFISIMAVIGQVLSSSCVAYGFARLRFKGRDFWFVLLLATLMVPPQVTLIPLFYIYKSIHWVDTFLPLIVPHFAASAFNVFLIRQYMLTLPRELDESATVDGCGALRTFLQVILPNCKPVLIVVAIFTFVTTWQDVLGPLIYLDNPEYRTVTLGLEYFRSRFVDNRHLLMTGAVLAMLPIAVIFLFLQRYIMSGMVTTGLKR